MEQPKVSQNTQKRTEFLNVWKVAQQQLSGQKNSEQIVQEFICPFLPYLEIRGTNI